MRYIWSIIVLIMLTKYSWAQGDFSPPSIDTFDGKTYAGITFGVTGDPELKALYRVFKSKLYPEALSISTTNSSILVDALLDRRGGVAKVQGVLLRFPLGGPNRGELTKMLEEEPSIWYHPRRTEDWHAVVYLKRGVTAFVEETDFGPVTKSVLLSKPQSLQNSISELLPIPTEIGEVPDPGRGWNRRVDVSGVLITATAPATVAADVFDGIQFEAREIAISQGTGPRVIFVRGSPNLYQISLIIDHNSDRGSYRISARVSLKVDTPFGDIEESVFHQERTGVLSQSRILGVLRAGIINANRELGAQINSLRPIVKSVDTAQAIERFMRLATVPPPAN